MSPWSSACSPRVAETVDCEISFSSIGSAPIFRNSARSWASWMSKLPSIWAPLRPSIPAGLSTKLMIGRETISLSSTTAKWPENSEAAAELPEIPGGALWSPRSAIPLVTSSNALRPSSVNSKVTLGWLVVGSVCCSGFLMSLPDSAGMSLIT